MKALSRLTLAVFLLAGVLALPSLAAQYSFQSPRPGISQLECAQFCAVVLCAQPQTCGLHTDANGQIACGCHGSGIEVIEVQ